MGGDINFCQKMCCSANAYPNDPIREIYIVHATTGQQNVMLLSFLLLHFC